MSRIEAFLMLLAIGIAVTFLTWLLTFVIEWIENQKGGRERENHEG